MIRTGALALLGLLVALAIGLAANAVSTDTVGLSERPLRSLRSLAPDEAAAPARPPRTRTRPARTQQEPAPTVPAPAPRTDGDGDESADDSSSRGRGRGRGRGGDDD